MEDRLKNFVKELHAFFESRDWKQFHSPKNISMGVASEAGELLQLFRFLSEKESAELSPQTLELVKNEIGDVFIFLVYLADILGLDAIEAGQSKLNQAAKKYTLELSHGKKDKL
jgi:dCTP diphosphatase